MEEDETEDEPHLRPGTRGRVPGRDGRHETSRGEGPGCARSLLKPQAVGPGRVRDVPDP